MMTLSWLALALLNMTYFTSSTPSKTGRKMVSKKYLAQHCASFVAFSAIPVTIRQLGLHLSLLLILFAHPVVVAGNDSTFQLQPEGCGADLESKFLSPDGKCPYSGLVPVKGSCTEYIPCISFGGELVRPLRRTECPQSAGLGFDIKFLRCSPITDFDNCLQRTCYSKGHIRIKHKNESTVAPKDATETVTEETTTSTLSFSSNTESSSTEIPSNDTEYAAVSSGCIQSIFSSMWFIFFCHLFHYIKYDFNLMGEAL